jgi:Fic-DOC domain mobile mystery protein B
LALKTKGHRSLTGPSPKGTTPLDDISGLKIHHIITINELYNAEFKNITKATKMLLFKSFTSEKLFTPKILFSIHKQMFSDVWTWAGKKRISNKNIGIDTALIDVKLRQHLDDILYLEKVKTPPIELSAIAHHRLVQIHPFENGNGRWARLVVNLYLKNAIKGYLKWPETDFFIDSSFRDSYLQSLKQADIGKYDELINIHHNLLEY